MNGPRDSAGEARIRRAMWWSAGAIGAVVVGVLATVAVFRVERAVTSPETLPTSGPSPSRDEPVTAPSLPFTDISSAAGIDFEHVNGAYGERLLPETMGGGVAFLDHDNDGDQDLLLLNSTSWPWRSPAADAAPLRLYQNDGAGQFRDASDGIGLKVRPYGMGLAVGDYDGDGLVDVFVTAVGSNHLLRNLGEGAFRDVTREAGVAGAQDAWSTGAAFFDADGDGDLDLFVCNYVAWSPEIDRAVDFRIAGLGRAYGPPTDFPGTQNYLYRNDGGTFTEVADVAGIHVVSAATGAPVGKGLAVRPVDVNNDGLLDLIVANDTVRNFLYVNQGAGAFQEVGIDFGLAFDNTGAATGAMGIDAIRFAQPGADGAGHRMGIAIGNFANEMSSLYIARTGVLAFSDDAIVLGVGAPSRRALTFGLAFADIDLDGREDLVAANGHVEPDIERVQASQRHAQSAQLFWNCGGHCPRQFVLASVTADLATPRVGRGLAYADIDADGDLDLALTQAGGRPALLRNDQALGNRWVRLRLRGRAPNLDAIGAKVSVFDGKTQQTRSVMPTRSYLSQVELPVTFGVGGAERVPLVEVRWPDGQRDSWRDLDVNQVHVLQQDMPEDSL